MTQLNINQYVGKEDGQQINALTWNGVFGDIQTKVNEIVTNVNNAPAGGSSDSHISFDATGKHNLTIKTTSYDQYPSNGKTKGGKINIESVSDIQLKPGDDIILYSHHRDLDKQDEVAVKVTDGEDVPVKLQLNAADVVLTTKDKTGNDASELNVTVNADTNERGYLKVRAQAIDLRCEKHGGVALLPKGYDSDGNMNKIKFEHGGGDGLEFGTFNTEKTSIFTDEYRFNKNGVWKMATRTKEASGKTIRDEGNVPAGKNNTGEYKYVKQADDFYDVIDNNDPQATTKDIIKTAYAMNGLPTVHTKITDKGNLEIGTETKYRFIKRSQAAEYNLDPNDYTEEPSRNVKTCENDFVWGPDVYYTASELEDIFGLQGASEICSGPDRMWTTIFSMSNNEDPDGYYLIDRFVAPNIKIDSGSELKLGGILDFGSSFNFGETDNGIGTQYKLTKKNKLKDCGKLQVYAVNNHETNNITMDQSKWVLSDPNDPSSALSLEVSPATVGPGETALIAEASIYDIIKLVNYMKAQGQGPWDAQL